MLLERSRRRYSLTAHDAASSKTRDNLLKKTNSCGTGRVPNCITTIKTGTGGYNIIIARITTGNGRIRHNEAQRLRKRNRGHTYDVGDRIASPLFVAVALIMHMELHPTHRGGKTNARRGRYHHHCSPRVLLCGRRGRRGGGEDNTHCIKPCYSGDALKCKSYNIKTIILLSHSVVIALTRSS